VKCSREHVRASAYTAFSAGSICPNSAPARTSNRIGGFNFLLAYSGTMSPSLAPGAFGFTAAHARERRDDDEDPSSLAASSSVTRSILG